MDTVVSETFSIGQWSYTIFPFVVPKRRENVNGNECVSRVCNDTLIVDIKS